MLIQIYKYIPNLILLDVAYKQYLFIYIFIVCYWINNLSNNFESWWNCLNFSEIERISVKLSEFREMGEFGEIFKTFQIISKHFKIVFKSFQNISNHFKPFQIILWNHLKWIEICEIAVWILLFIFFIKQIYSITHINVNVLNWHYELSMVLNYYAK